MLVTVHVLVTTLDYKYDVANAIKVEAHVILKGTHFCPCNCFEDLKCRSNAKIVSWFSVFFMLVSVRFHVCKITLNQFWWLNGHISESKLVPVRNC